MGELFKSYFIFVTAAVFEILGCYCFWVWLREYKSAWYVLLGIVLLSLYGYCATLQHSNFARVYSLYGGVFILLTFVWSMMADKFKPDTYDYIGLFLVIIGVIIIFYAPRH